MTFILLARRQASAREPSFFLSELAPLPTFPRATKST